MSRMCLASTREHGRVVDRKMLANPGKTKPKNLSGTMEGHMATTKGRRAPITSLMILAILLQCLLCASSAHGQSWQMIPGPGPAGGVSGSAVTVEEPDIAVRANGEFFVTYIESPFGVHLKHYDGSSWSEYPAGSAAGYGIAPVTVTICHRTQVALDTGEEPVVAFYADGHIYVRKYNGSTWVGLGGSDSGTGLDTYPEYGTDNDNLCLSCDTLGNPTVCWKKRNSFISFLILKHWNGAAWTGLGGSDTSGGIYPYDSSKNYIWPYMTLDSAGRPVIASGFHYSPYWAQPKHTYVKHWNGSSWQGYAGSDTGNGVGGYGETLSPCVAVDNSDYPVVAHFAHLERKAAVHRWNGSDWVEIDTAVIDPTEFEPRAMAADSLGRMVIAGLRLGSIEGYRLAGTSWESLGRIAAATTPTGLNLSLDDSDNIYLVCRAEVGGVSDVYAWKHTESAQGAAWEERNGSASAGGISNTPETSRYPTAVVDSAGSVSVGWVHNNPLPSAYLKRSSGAGWDELDGSASGAGLGAPYANQPCLALDKQDRILAAFVGDGLCFKRWTGAEWEELAGSGTGAGIQNIEYAYSSYGLFVTSDEMDRPIVGMSYGNFPANSIIVRFWNGISWGSDNPANTSPGYAPAAARDPQGGFWLAFDKGDWNGTTATIEIYRYFEGAWEDKGTLTAQPNNRMPAIAVDSQGRVIVAWMSGTIGTPGSYRVMVSRWDGTTWSGLAGSDAEDGISLPSNDAGLPAIAVAEGDVPVVAFIQEAASNWLCVKSFNGSSWTEFGDGSASEPGLGAGCANVVYYRDPPTAVPGWVPYFTETALAGNGSGTFFCAWERSGADEIYGKVYGAEPLPAGEYIYFNDEVSRLTDVKPNNGITISYEYDSAGNRGRKEVTSKLVLSAGEMNPVSGGIDNATTGVPVLQLALNVSDDEAILLDRLEFSGTGTADESQDISMASLWLDSNGDGDVDAADQRLGIGALFTGDNGVISFPGLFQTLPAGQRTYLLLTYDLAGTALADETFSVSLTGRKKVSATGLTSGHAIYALGAPVEGAMLTVSTDMSAPTFAGIQSATAQDKSAYLEWQPATDASTPITYHIWQGTEPFEGTVTGQPAYTTQELSYTVPGLVNGQPYYFVVRAADSAGNTDTNTVEGYAVPQAALFVLTATAGPNGSVQPEPSQFVYEDGTDVYVIPSGDVGYHFTAWTGDVPVGQESSEPLALTMNGDKAVEAAFERSRGTVVIDVTPETARWTFVDGDGVLHSGVGDATVSGMPTGQIPITWEPLAGFTAPTSPLTKTLGRDTTVVFSAVYGPVVMFSVQPQDQTRYTDESVQFEVQAGGGLGALEYQWWFDNGAKAVVPVGGNSPVLSILDLTLSNGGTYWCEVTDDMPATYASANAALQVGEHLEITQHPVGGEKRVGESHTFTVDTTGGIGSMAYLWKKGEVEIPGETGPTYTLPSLTLTDSGAYTVTVSDEYTDVRDSNTAVLEVTTGLPVTALAALIVLLAIVVILANKRSLSRNSDALMGGSTKR